MIHSPFSRSPPHVLAETCAPGGSYVCSAATVGLPVPVECIVVLSQNIQCIVWNRLLSTRSESFSCGLCWLAYQTSLKIKHVCKGATLTLHAAMCAFPHTTSGTSPCGVLIGLFRSHGCIGNSESSVVLHWIIDWNIFVRMKGMRASGSTCSLRSIWLRGRKTEKKTLILITASLTASLFSNPFPILKWAQNASQTMAICKYMNNIESGSISSGYMANSFRRQVLWSSIGSPVTRLSRPLSLAD